MAPGPLLALAHCSCLLLNFDPPGQTEAAAQSSTKAAEPTAAAAQTRLRRAVARIGNWKADSQLLNQLGEETTVEGLKFRPPARYRPFNVPLKAGRASAWIERGREQGAAGSIVVSVIPRNPDNHSDLTTILDRSLGPYKRRYAKDWSRSDAEQGKIAGLLCARAHWSGTCTEGPKELLGKPMHGIVYVEECGDKLVQVLIKGGDPGFERSLPVCETSALTLQKAPDQ